VTMSTVGVPQSPGTLSLSPPMVSCKRLGVILFGMIVYTDASIYDVLESVEWDVVACDEHNGIGAFTDARNALGQAAKVCYSLRSVEGFGHGDGCWSYAPCVQMYSYNLLVMRFVCDITRVINAARVIIVTCDITRVINIMRVIDIVHIVTGGWCGCHPWRCAQGLHW
jgi:hypothetical protein